jgi:uncharacterized protein (UPF0332 family)
MKGPHLLLAGNPRRVLENIRPLVSGRAASAIEKEIRRNAAGLYNLGAEHYNFAANLQAADWRQCVSRAYYGAYNCARSVRFAEDGTYSTDSSDHKKIEELPKGFPNLNTYTNRLRLLRDDRNLCDYDHTVSEAELAITRDEGLALVGGFLRDAKLYLRNRGIRV